MNGLHIEMYIGEYNDHNLMGIFYGLHILINNRTSHPVFASGN